MRKITSEDLRLLTPRRVAKGVGRWFLEGWYAPGDRMAPDRVRLLTCNYTSNVIGNLVGGTFWTGYLILLNAGDGFIGTMSMICTACNMLQFLAPLLLERFSSRKRLLTALRAILYAVNVGFVALIPAFPVGQQAKLAMVGASVFVVNIINALISPGISIWHVQSVPQNVRRYFYSIITMTVGAVVALVNLAGSKVMDLMTARGAEYGGILILRGFTLLLCALEIFLYSRIREYPYESSGERFRIRDLVTQPFRERKYLFTVGVAFLWCFAANIPGSYYTVYLMRELKVSYSWITLISMINVPTVLVFTPLWRKILEKRSWFGTLTLALIGYLCHFVILAAVTKGALFLYPAALIVAFFFAVGINLAFTGIPYVNMPKKNQTVFIGFYSSAANLAALLGITLGKRFVLATEELRVSLLGIAMGNKQLLMLITAGMMVIATFGIAWIRKKVGND